MPGMQKINKLLLSLILLIGINACESGSFPSTDASLSTLVISAGSINPVFDSSTLSYTLTTSSALTTITPTVNYAYASVTVNGSDVASGATSVSIPLALDDTVINIVVTAQDGSATQSYSVTINRVFGTFDLIDPTPGASDQFGTIVVQLLNGNIVVSDPNDSSIATNNGAVHLYSPLFSTPIASIYGDMANDYLGRTRITALSNSNYVIVSRLDDIGGIADAGSIRLVNGDTGVQISILTGDGASDLSGTKIIDLGNNNYVISSPSDNVGGIAVAGSVRLMNGSTGAQIGATLAGDVAGDALGHPGITVLSNYNYVVASAFDDEGGIVDAGSVRMFNGSTAVQVGPTLAGDVTSDLLGLRGTTALANGNYVIASSQDNEGGIMYAGSVRLINGSTGVQIGIALVGNTESDLLGTNGVAALGNGNYVFASFNDDVAGLVDAGSVRLVNGSTGVQISMRAGDSIGDSLGGTGFSPRPNITVLDNNNYVIASPFDDVGSIVDAGSVQLINGSTGAQINSLEGNVEDDQLGINSITALANNNYVIASANDDVAGVVDAGSVRLIDGSTGVQIISLQGDVEGDQLGLRVNALGNNNYVIRSDNDDENGIVDAGSVRLVNGNTGVQIGATLAGDISNDQLGRDVFTVLSNNNYVIASPFDDEGGIVDAGSARMADGITGEAIGTTIVGAATDDLVDVDVIKPISSDYYILSQPRVNNAGLVDSGRVRIVVP